MAGPLPPPPRPCAAHTNNRRDYSPPLSRRRIARAAASMARQRRDGACRERQEHANGNEQAPPPAPMLPPEQANWNSTKRYPPAYVDTYDPATEIFYSSKTLSMLSVVIGALVHVSGALSGGTGEREASRPEVGIGAGLFVFLSFHVMYGPTAPLTRPHPLVWRFVHGVCLVYLLSLVYMLFVNASDARLLLKHLPFSSDLGVPLEERSYGEDCRVFTPEHPTNKMAVVWATINDEFVVAHVLGWFGKAMVLRSYTLCILLSVGFEVMEVTFRHMLPNFNECWWDSWVLDVLMCNFVGIYAGMAVVNRLNNDRRNALNSAAASAGAAAAAAAAAADAARGFPRGTSSDAAAAAYSAAVANASTAALNVSTAALNAMPMRSTSRSPPATARRVGGEDVGIVRSILLQFTPGTWDVYDWGVHTNPRRFSQCLVLCAMVLCFDVSAFFLKYALWVPPSHVLNTFRLVLWFLMGLPAVNEYYVFMQRSAAKKHGFFLEKLGAYAWTLVATMLIEVLVSIKFGRGLYPNPCPRHIVVGWAAAGVVTATVLALWSRSHAYV